MARIKQLPPHEAHKIAAGEVVERPANVVKELVENALDAQATSITMYIEEAGKKLIRIVDNGHGMDKEDAHLCFGHHATSKLNSVDDLQTITTFGFRGEALSSIAAVSKVTLITKEQGASEGVRLVLTGGQLEHETFASCNPGTDISIENIFFNVPARKKFLKTDDTEWRQIVALFQALCLDYQAISFKLFHEGQLVHNCPATTDLTSRIAQLWDHTFSTAMLPLATAKDELSIKGAISHQHYARYDRNQIFLFVNNRWIKNQHLSRALVKGYLNVLPPARYPAAFLFIEVPTHEVDINIHPRKEEVQFLHPRKVESLLQEAVKKTLENHLTNKINRSESSTKTFDFEQPVFSEQGMTTPPRTSTPTFSRSQHAWAPQPFLSQPFSPHPPTSISSTSSRTPFEHLQFEQLPKNIGRSPFLPGAPAPQMADTQQLIDLPQENEAYAIIGQLNKTYILLEREEGLFVVDQHAAHERILYEQFKQKFHTTAATQLLFPHVITLSSDDIATVTPHLPFIAEQGISLELFGEQQLIIQATPVVIKEVAVQELIYTVIGWLNEHKTMEKAELTKLLTEKLHAQMACKAAVKAGDILTVPAMEELLKNLQKTANRFSCPHGRPTSWLITTYEIEKKFKRKI